MLSKSLILNMGNAGVEVNVSETNYGLEFKLSSSAYGNLNNSSSVLTNREGLKKIRDSIDEFLVEYKGSDLFNSLATPSGDSSEEVCTEEKEMD